MVLVSSVKVVSAKVMVARVVLVSMALGPSLQVSPTGHTKVASEVGGGTAMVGCMFLEATLSMVSSMSLRLSHVCMQHYTIDVHLSHSNSCQ